MRPWIARVGIALASAVLAASTSVRADSFSGVPNTTVDWTQEFCLTDCTGTTTAAPFTQVDLTMTAPGVTFTSLSSVFQDIGMTTVDSGATSTLGSTESAINFSPANTSDVFFSVGFSPPSTSTPFTFLFEQWNGSQLVTTNSSATSSDVVTWTGSAWDITPMTTAVPEPGTLALLVPGLLGLGIFGRHRLLAR